MTKPVKIHLLSGQSNMTGRGNLGDLNKPAADQKTTLVRLIIEPQNVDKYKEFKAPGMQAVIAVTGFGGNNQGIHWSGNGESYWLMGEAMGQGMV